MSEFIRLLKYIYCRKTSSVQILSRECSSCDTFHTQDVMRFLMRSCCCHRHRQHHMEVSAFMVHYDQVNEMCTLFLGFFVSSKLFVETCLCSKAYGIHSTVV